MASQASFLYRHCQGVDHYDTYIKCPRIQLKLSKNHVEIVSSRMLSGNHVENCLQRSTFDDRYQNNYEEHFAKPYGEVCSKDISLEAKVPPFMEKVQFSVDDYSSKDCSLHQN